MPTRSAPPDILTILSAIVGAPILFAFLLGGLPVLIPLLIHRWLVPGKTLARVPAIAVPQLAG